MKWFVKEFFLGSILFLCVGKNVYAKDAESITNKSNTSEKATKISIKKIDDDILLQKLRGCLGYYATGGKKWDATQRFRDILEPITKELNQGQWNDILSLIDEVDLKKLVTSKEKEALTRLRSDVVDMAKNAPKDPLEGYFYDLSQMLENLFEKPGERKETIQKVYTLINSQQSLLTLKQLEKMLDYIYSAYNHAHTLTEANSPKKTTNSQESVSKEPSKIKDANQIPEKIEEKKDTLQTSDENNLERKKDLEELRHFVCKLIKDIDS